MSLPIEESWRPVPGWEGRYEVSNLGRVRGLTRGGPTGRLLTSTVNRYGYVRVGFSRDNKRTWMSVHRLVAEAFLEREEGQYLVRHLNGDRLDNRVENVAWGTDSDNAQDTVKHGKHNWRSRTHCLRGHEYTLENTGYRAHGARVCRQCSRERDHRSPAFLADIRARAAARGGQQR